MRTEPTRQSVLIRLDEADFVLVARSATHWPQPGCCPGDHYWWTMVDVFNPAAITAVGVVVGGVLGSASNDLQARTSERLADRRIKKNGDHIAIDSMFAYSLDNHLYTQFKVGVAAAPSVSFSTPAKLDADRIDQWQRHLEQVAKLPRDYLSPDELIRYQELSSYERMLVFTPPSAYAP